MKKKIIGYQSHMFFPFHNDMEFKKALEEFLSKYAYDEDNQTFDDGFQLNCIFYLNGVKERNEFKKEYDAFVNEWDGDVQGSDDFWASDEILLEESSKTYEVILTENEYRKVCGVLNESPTDIELEKVYKHLLEIKNNKDGLYFRASLDGNKIKIVTDYKGVVYYIKYDKAGNGYSQDEPAMTVYDKNFDMKSYTTEWEEYDDVHALIGNLSYIDEEDHDDDEW